MIIKTELHWSWLQKAWCCIMHLVMLRVVLCCGWWGVPGIDIGSGWCGGSQPGRRPTHWRGWPRNRLLSLHHCHYGAPSSYTTSAHGKRYFNCTTNYHCAFFLFFSSLNLLEKKLHFKLSLSSPTNNRKRLNLISFSQAAVATFLFSPDSLSLG